MVKARDEGNIYSLMREAKDFLEMFDGLRTRARALRLGRSRSQPLRYRSSTLGQESWSV
jgi:hypothetical protein